MRTIILICLIRMCLLTYPVVFVHGIGDACSFPGMIELMSLLRESLNTEVKCFEVGNGFISSWFMEFSKQAEILCEAVKNDPISESDFSIMGISQGSLLARYIIEKCNTKGTVKRYVSYDGPQMGIASLPKLTCPYVCDAICYMFSKVVYSGFLQKNLGPSGYYKARFSHREYLKANTFLSDINNEREIKNPEYKERIMKLEKMLLIKNKDDTVITPVESSWFIFYDEDGKELVPLEDTLFYKEDFIGIRFLKENNRLFYANFEGDHVRYTKEEIINYLIPVLL